ncbi:uncharacterized protein LOC144712683 [Wolffia australiana]
MSAEEDAPNSPITTTKKPCLDACDAVRYYSNIGGKKFKCTLCGTVVNHNKYHCSTPLWRHLENFHHKVFQSLKGKIGQQAQERSVIEMFASGDTKQYYIGRTMERTKEELVWFICLSDSPWNIVKKKYFVRLLRYIAQEEIPVPSVKAIKAKAFALYQDMKRFVRKKLATVACVWLTLDAWTSENNVAFLGVTVHWVCAITTDNASNNKKMMSILDEQVKLETPQFSANRHVLNLVVQAGMSSLRVSDSPSESLIICEDYYRQSPDVDHGSILPMFCVSDLGDVINRLREIVAGIRGSTQRQERYAALCQQFGLPDQRKIPLDCPTRWNSTYAMLVAAVEKKDIIYIMALNVLQKQVLCDKEWAMVKEFAGILQPLQLAVTVACRKKSPTANEAIVIIKAVMRHLNGVMLGIREGNILRVNKVMSTEQRTSVYKACEAMKSKMSKYASALTHNTAFTIAALVDPSMKLHLLDRDQRDDTVMYVQRLLESPDITDNINAIRSDSSAYFRPEWTSSAFFSEALDELLPSNGQTPAISPGHEREVYMSSPPLKGTKPLHWWKVTDEQRSGTRRCHRCRDGML